MFKRLLIPVLGLTLLGCSQALPPPLEAPLVPDADRPAATLNVQVFPLGIPDGEDAAKMRRALHEGTIVVVSDDDLAPDYLPVRLNDPTLPTLEADPSLVHRMLAIGKHRDGSGAYHLVSWSHLRESPPSDAVQRQLLTEVVRQAQLQDPRSPLCSSSPLVQTSHHILTFEPYGKVVLGSSTCLNHEEDGSDYWSATWPTRLEAGQSAYDSVWRTTKAVVSAQIELPRDGRSFVLSDEAELPSEESSVAMARQSHLGYGLSKWAATLKTGAPEAKGSFTIAPATLSKHGHGEPFAAKHAIDVTWWSVKNGKTHTLSTWLGLRVAPPSH